MESQCKEGIDFIHFPVVVSPFLCRLAAGW